MDKLQKHKGHSKVSSENLTLGKGRDNKDKTLQRLRFVLNLSKGGFCGLFFCLALFLFWDFVLFFVGWLVGGFVCLFVLVFVFCFFWRGLGEGGMECYILSVQKTPTTTHVTSKKILTTAAVGMNQEPIFPNFFSWLLLMVQVL